MTKQSADDIINRQVLTIENDIAMINDDIHKTKDTIRKLDRKLEGLTDKRARLKKELDKAKTEMTALKRFVWQSDNPSVVALRNEVLLAAKLIKDQEVKN